MQRNMDLVRTILMRMEDNTSGWAPRDLGIKAFPPKEIGYHCHIMMQEGLIEGCDVTNSESSGSGSPPDQSDLGGPRVPRSVRDQERWNRAKAIVAKVGSAPISVWMKILSDLVLKSVEAVASKPG